MMTKDEERNLLAKIEKLLNSADPDGYVASAFRGCVDLAKSNIENDFCQSLEENLRLTEEDASRNYMKLCDAYEKLTDEKASAEKYRKQLEDERREHAVNISRMQQQYSDVSTQLQERGKEIESMKKQIEKQHETICTLADSLIALTEQLIK